MKTPVCLWIAILAVFFVASTSASSSFCDKADDKVLCSQLVGGAKTWEEAMINALNDVKKKAAGGKSVVDVVAAKLPKNLKAATKDSILQVCHEDYVDIMDNLNGCTRFLKADPTSSLTFTLSAIPYYSHCTHILANFNATVAEATHFYQEIYKLAAVLLSVAEKKP